MEPSKPALPVCSGTTTERLLRAALLAVVINGFAAAFLWDGYFGYARQNVESLVKSLGLPVQPRRAGGLAGDPLPAIDPKLTKELGRSLVAQQAPARRGRIPDDAPSPGAPGVLPAISRVAETLGEPALRNGDDAYYLGPAGHIKIHRSRGRIVSVEWVDGPAHTATDLVYQRWIGYVLGVLGLVSLGQFVRVATTRAVLSDEGLRIRGRPLIPLEAISGIRDKRGSGGTVEIEFRDGKAAGSVELDGYVYRNRDAIIEAICEAKGFVNPLQPEDTPEQT